MLYAAKVHELRTTIWSTGRKVITNTCYGTHRTRQDTEDVLCYPLSLITTPGISIISCHWLKWNQDERMWLTVRNSSSLKSNSRPSHTIISTLINSTQINSVTDSKQYNTHPFMLEHLTQSIKEFTLPLGLVDEQRLHAVTGGRVVTLGVFHCMRKHTCGLHGYENVFYFVW